MVIDTAAIAVEKSMKLLFLQPGTEKFNK